MKQFLFTLGFVMLAACGGDKTYTLDGVPVVLDGGVGPDQQHMAMTVELFRQAALEHWGIDSDLTVWRALAEIHYTTAPVEGQAFYDYDSSTVWSAWIACTLDVPLYPAFAAHYGFLLGGPDEDDSDREWAEELQHKMYKRVCDSVKPKRTIRLPW